MNFIRREDIKIWKYLFLCLSWLILCQAANSQAVGDYRTNLAGTWNWTTVANWQRCVTAGTWVGATSTTYPGQNAGAGTVNILNNTTVTIGANVPNSIGALNIDGGNLNSYVQFTANRSLTVTGQTYLNSNTAAIAKAILVNVGIFRTGSLLINSGGDTQDAYLRVSTGTATIDQNVTMTGTNLQTYLLFAGAGTISVGGNISGGTITSTAGGGGTPTSGTVTLNGSASQSTDGYTFYNFRVNNAAGITLNGTATISNILTMTQGNVSTGAFSLILSNGTSANLSYTSGIIAGKFQRAIALPLGTQYLFPVGTTESYNPLKITFSNLTAGQLSVQFQPADIGTAGLPLNDAGTDVYDRQTTGYWTMIAVGTMASTSYSVDLNYTGFTGVDALARIMKRTNGGNLTSDGSHGTVSSPSITRTGMSGIATTTTDLAIGKPNPRFTTQPSDATGCAVTFTVVVSGKPAVTYQWQENSGSGFTNVTNGGVYSGATSSVLSINGAPGSMNGNQYRCIATDVLGYQATSSSALLTIVLPSVSMGYTYSSDLTVAPASGANDLTDFPLLVSFTASPDRDRFRTVVNGGHLSNSSGYDLIFTDASGNRLDHQLEFYSATTGQYVAWVRIPLLSHTSPATIKILYGNPTITTDPSVNTVWASNYKSVWHLNGTDYTDGTSNANNGTASNVTSAAGKIAGAQSFNGTTSYIITPTNGFVPNNNNQTISIWANYAVSPVGNRNLITFQNAVATSAIQLGFRGGNAVAWKWGGVLLADAGPAPSINAWHYYVYTYDGTNSRLYIDGVELDNSTVAPQTAMPNEGNIGRYNNGEYLAAVLDEPRFSMSPKSADWILTEYNNQNNPAGFLTLGSETTTSILGSLGVCSTTYTLNQGFPAGGTYSGTGVSGTNFNASLAGVGTFPITYTITDGAGCSNSAVKNITVTPLPSAPAASNVVCCYLNILDLTAVGTNLKWYSDAGLTTLVGTGSPFATGKTVVGVYTYYVTQTINGCQSAETAVTLTIVNSISINTQPLAATICDGNNATFSVTATGFNLSYQWQENGVNIVNGGIYSGALTTTLLLTNPGIAKNGRTYRCVVSSSCGASPVNSTAVVLTVTSIPVATFSYTGSPYCPNAANPLPTFSGGGVAGTFSSTTGLVFVSTSTGQVNIGASTPGTYTVTNTIAAAGGCGQVIATSPITIISGITWTGAAGTNWNTAGNWSCSFIPNGQMSVTIPNVANKPVLSTGSVGSVNNLTIGVGSSLTISGNTLQIAGTITNNGTLTASSGSVTLNGSAAQSIPASTFAGNAVNNLTVNNNAGVTLLGSLGISGILRLQSGNLASNGNLTLLSTAAQTALVDGTGTGQLTGLVTMQRYLPVGFGYKYFSSPFSDAIVNEFGDNMNLGAAFPSFYKYDESRTSSGWVSYVTPANPLVVLSGYSVNFGSLSVPNTVDVKGTLNNGALSVNLFNNNNLYTKGYNLIGNPYPSPINWDAASGWTKTSIDNALYYFQASATDQYGGSYCTYVNGESSDGNATAVIPSMQGFFVHVTDGPYPVTGTLAMNNNVRVNDLTHAFLKSAKTGAGELLRLTAGFADDTTYADPMVVYVDPDATEGMDSQYDALKLYNTDMNKPNLFSVSNVDLSLFSINGLPAIPDTLYEIPLGLRIYRDGMVIFSIRDVDATTASKGISITDNVAGVTQDLLGGNKYQVNLLQGAYRNRFYLNIGSFTTGINRPEAGGLAVKIYNRNTLLVADISEITGSNSVLTVYNIIGQPVFTRKIYESGHYEFDTKLTQGMYIVNVVSGKEKVSVKIFIKG